MYNYLHKMAAFLSNKQYDELDDEFKRICEQLSGYEVAEQIKSVSTLDYFMTIEKALKKAIKLSKDASSKAIYFEYDMDNEWSSSFFLCNDYSSERDGNDEWASEWSDSLKGPNNIEFSKIYNKYGFNNVGATIYLIARTISGFAKITERIKGIKVSVCIGYHDQSPVFRIREVETTRKKKYSLKDRFFVNGSESNIFGCAIAPENIHWNSLPEEGIAELNQVKFRLKDGTYADFLNNNVGFLLCSEKLREVVDRNKSNNDSMQWIETEVESDEGEIRKYFILHIIEKLDCIDLNESKFFKSVLSDYARYICLSKVRIESKELFKIKYPEGKSGPSNLIVSGQIRKDFEDNGITGAIFEKIATN